MKILYSHHVYAGRLYAKGNTFVEGMPIACSVAIPLKEYTRAKNGFGVLRHLYRDVRRQMLSFQPLEGDSVD